MLRFNEFVEHRKLQDGWQELCEAIANTNLHDDDAKLDAVPPPPEPKNVDVPEVPEQQKSFIRRFWEANKRKIAYGTLTVAAIGLLLGAGIPWFDLWKYALGSLGYLKNFISDTKDFMTTGTDVSKNLENMARNLLGSGALRLIIRNRNYFLKTPTGEKQISLDDLGQFLKQAAPDEHGQLIKIDRDMTSRAGAEEALRVALETLGLKDNQISWTPIPSK